MSDKEAQARDAIQAVAQDQAAQYRMVMGQDPPAKVRRQMEEAARKAAERADRRGNRHFLWPRR